MPKIALVVNEPPPYRIPVFNRVAAMPGVTLRVIFCCRREPNRQWDLPPIAFDAVYLRERISTVQGRYIHNNPDVLVALERFRPDVVVGNGFNPTHLYAMAWCGLRRRPYVPMTDGTLRSEQALSRLHAGIRRQVYRRARAFIAASQGGVALYQSYGVSSARCYQSCLCIDNARFRSGPDAPPKSRDFIVCGRLEPGKSPDVALEVAARCATLLGRRMRLLFVGSGSMDAPLRQMAAALADRVDVEFHGFAAQRELPALYQSARLFLFPTRADVWGVVANEACAAGLPVIVTPEAGVAGELVIHGHNGYVLPLDVEVWAALAASLLANEGRRRALGQRSQLLVEPYSFGRAAQGIVDACIAALGSSSDSYAAVRRPVW
jgi:glycosyltransferase involved in cell wall biosynthesis